MYDTLRELTRDERSSRKRKTTKIANINEHWVIEIKYERQNEYKKKMRRKGKKMFTHTAVYRLSLITPSVMPQRSPWAVFYSMQQQQARIKKKKFKKTCGRETNVCNDYIVSFCLSLFWRVFCSIILCINVAKYLRSSNAYAWALSPMRLCSFFFELKRIKKKNQKRIKKNIPLSSRLCVCVFVCIQLKLESFKGDTDVAAMNILQKKAAKKITQHDRIE